MIKIRSVLLRALLEREAVDTEIGRNLVDDSAHVMHVVGQCDQKHHQKHKFFLNQGIGSLERSSPHSHLILAELGTELKSIGVESHQRHQNGELMERIEANLE